MKLLGFKNLRTGVTAAALSSAVLLTACDTVQVQSDPTDQCNGFRQQISSARKTEINERIGSAAAGALLGGLLVAAAGGDRDDITRGVLIAGLSGFALAYFNQKQAQTKDRNALLASVNSDARTERNLVSKTGRAASQLRSCRQKQIRTLTTQIRRGQVDKGTARARLRTIKSRIASDNQLISATFGGIDQRVDAYISATAATAKVDRSLIDRRQRQQARANPDQRRAAASARARTPQVDSVTRESRQQQASDSARRASVERDVKALEALLS